jgi:hypothetical protein
MVRRGKRRRCSCVRILTPWIEMMKRCPVGKGRAKDQPHKKKMAVGGREMLHIHGSLSLSLYFAFLPDISFVQLNPAEEKKIPPRISSKRHIQNKH